METVLITAIGSFSASCVIEKLHEAGYRVIGTDIYPKEWHIESYECDEFYQVPLAINKSGYINKLIDICQKNEVNYLIPLTDLEIDVINLYRNQFKDADIRLCIQQEATLKVARNKYSLFEYFKNRKEVNSIPTLKCPTPNIGWELPVISKPIDGRSSEGLTKIIDNQILNSYLNKENYILQKFIEGNIVTVDYVRCETTGHDFSIPREELIRTKNGAGLSVKIFQSKKLSNTVSYIGKELGINGAVNMEFISSGGHYFLMDINPRFSAGIAFTCLTGYDIVLANINCFKCLDILPPIKIEETYMVKGYREFITRKD